MTTASMTTPRLIVVVFFCFLASNAEPCDRKQKKFGNKKQVAVVAGCAPGNHIQHLHAAAQAFQMHPT